MAATHPPRTRTELLSRCFGEVFATPFNRASVLLQGQNGNLGVQNGSLRPYSSLWNCFWRVIDEQGFFSLFRGTLAHVLHCAAVNFFFPLVEHQVNRLIPSPRNDDDDDDSWQADVQRAASSALTITVMRLVLVPLDLAGTRLGCDMHKGDPTFQGYFHLFSEIFRNNGPLGIFTGFSASLAAGLLQRFLQPRVVKALTDANPYREGTPRQRAVSRVVVLKIATLFRDLYCYPLRVLTVQMWLEAEVPHERKQLRGAVAGFGRIIERDGIAGLYAGDHLAWLLAEAVMFSSFLQKAMTLSPE